MNPLHRESEDRGESTESGLQRFNHPCQIQDPKIFAMLSGFYADLGLSRVRTRFARGHQSPYAQDDRRLLSRWALPGISFDTPKSLTMPTVCTRQALPFGCLDSHERGNRSVEQLTRHKVYTLNKPQLCRVLLAACPSRTYTPTYQNLLRVASMIATE